MQWLTFQPQNAEHWACRWFIARFVDPDPEWKIAQPSAPVRPGTRVLGPTTRLKTLLGEHGLSSNRALKRLAREAARAARAPDSELPPWAAPNQTPPAGTQPARTCPPPSRHFSTPALPSQH